MKFGILCVGSHGDIRPYVALGVKLKAEGHDVCIASHKKAEDLCKKYGLDFALVEGDLTEIGNTQNPAKILECKGFKKLSALFFIMKLFKETLQQQIESSFLASKDVDVLIYNPAAFAGPHLAEFYNIPSFRIDLQPELRTKQHPSCIVPIPQFFGSFGNVLGHFISDQMFWQPIRSQINRWRKQKLKLRKMHFLGPTKDPVSREICNIVAFSPLLVTRPSDWGPHIHMTGFCRLFDAQKWTPSEGLQAFVENGVPAIYIGFGSLSPACPKSVVETIVTVLKKRKMKAVIQDSLPGIQEMELPDHILVINYAPHDWLFPRVKAVVHHGGVGTTAAGLYAGKPTLVMPFLLDQFFWGKKVFELEVGPRPLPIKQCSEELFESSLEKLLMNPSYQKNAFEVMTNLLEEEEGTEKAYRILHQSLFPSKNHK